MAAILDLMGYVQDLAGNPLGGRTVALRNNADGAVLDSTHLTDSNGKWSFDNLEESVSYRVDVAMGATSTQVVSRRPWSGEMLSLYVRDELRMPATAAFAVGGNISVGGTLTVAGATTLANTQINGTLGVTGLATLASASIGSLTATNAQVNGTLGVVGTTTLGVTNTGALGVAGAIAATTTITAGTGLRATAGGLVVSAGGMAVTGTGTYTGILTLTGQLWTYGGLIAATGGLTVDAGGAVIKGGLIVDDTGLIVFEHNISIGEAAPNYGGGVGGIIYIANANSVPVATPGGGGLLYVDAGRLRFRGSSGTITTIAPA